MQALSLLVLVTSIVFAQDPIEAQLASLTVEQKVGQLFMTSVAGTSLSAAEAEILREFPAGAVALFPRNVNGQSAGEIAALVNQLQANALASSGIPLIIAIDHEGGEVQRIQTDVTYLPDPLVLGAVNDPTVIQAFGAAVGAELSALGINMNLAPVADLTTREDALNRYSVMHKRTWGSDPLRVGWQVAAYSAGLAEHGVIGVLKHYPGHGGARDSHAVLPIVTTDAATARATALKAFEVAVVEGVPAIMVGHLIYQELEPDGQLPATLSPTMIGILREDFGFQGVIMTDAMDMAAIKNYFPIPEAAVQFIQAGGDLFVAGPYMTRREQQQAFERLVQAVETGEITATRLDASVRRILTLKANYGLLEWIPLETAPTIPTAQTAAALREVYLNAATVIRDTQQLLPLAPAENVLIVHPFLYGEIASACQALDSDVVLWAFNYTPLDYEPGRVKQLAETADKVVVFLERARDIPQQARLATIPPPEKTIVVALSSPYDVELAPAASTWIALYDSLPAAQQAICELLYGQQPFVGTVPLEIR
jgi:beta-N-acetylhexosaminidase